jgi:uncharacterized alkaline shock family protein YloU
MIKEAYFVSDLNTQLPFAGDDPGAVRIADEVVNIIAGLAATEVPGVAGMSGGLVGGIAELLGKKNLSKGVKTRIGDKEVSVDLYVILEYGINIPATAVQIQEKVKGAIESMSGLKVVEINIHVQGITNIDKIKENQNKDIY